MSMRHIDSEVNEIFQEYEIEATNVLVEIFKNNNLETQNLKEKAHLIIAWMDNLCHEVAYHKHKELNYDDMTNIVINEIVHILTKKD